MGGLMEPLLEIAAERAAKEAAEKAAAEAYAESEKNTSLKNIRNLMKKLNMTAQQAMNILDIPEDKQAKYKLLI